MSTDPEDVLRVQPPYGPLAWLLRNRDKVDANTPGKLIPNDLTVITGRGIARQWQLVAGLPVAHGTVADEAAMLALHVDSAETAYPRWVVPGDSCLRADDPGWRWHCIAGHGTALADWERRPLGGALSGLATSGHTHAISAITGLQSALDGKQAALANAAALARLTSAGPGQPPMWDGDNWPVVVGTTSHHYLSLDWARRCAVAGAYPLDSTLSAIDAFVAALIAAGLIGQIMRANLFCGPSIDSCYIPLIVRGGNASDLNTGFVSADYSEATGLQGNGSKHLATGLAESALQASSVHMSVYSRTDSTAACNEIGAWSNAYSRCVLSCSYSGTSLADIYQVSDGGRVTATGQRSDGYWLVSRTSATSMYFARGGVTLATNTGSSIGSRPSSAFYVFGDGRTTERSTRCLAGYTIGLGLTEAQGTALATAMQAFQAALGRSV